MYSEKIIFMVTNVQKTHFLKFPSSYYLILNKNKTQNSHKQLFSFSISPVLAAEPCLICLIYNTECTSDAEESIKLSMKVPIPQRTILSLILSTWQVRYCMNAESTSGFVGTDPKQYSYQSTNQTSQNKV